MNFSTQFVWMLIFCSMLFVSVAFIITSRIYKKMYPEMKLNSEEVVLIPFRYVWPNPKLRFKFCFLIWLWKFVHFIILSSYWPLCPLMLIVSQSSDWSSCPLIGPLIGHHVYYVLWKCDWQTDMENPTDTIPSKNWWSISRT